MIKVAITDDHPLLLQGVKNILDGREGFQVTGCYTSGGILLAALQKEQPDVLLLDLQLAGDPQGKDLIVRLRQDYPELRILVLTSNDNAYNIQIILNAGAQGYLLKNIEQDLLMEAIETIYKGEEYLSPEVKNILLDSLRKDKTKKVGTESLTPRELDILRLIAEEKTSHEIGEILHLSYRTIETYRLGIMQKLGVKNMVGMVKKAILLGIIK